RERLAAAPEQGEVSRTPSSTPMWFGGERWTVRLVTCASNGLTTEFVGDGFEPVRGLVAGHVEFRRFFRHVRAHGSIRKRNGRN
ncbi:hypothetical protein BRD06_07255, partial [Halobacteriales archaeon QS_9_67_15]